MPRVTAVHRPDQYPGTPNELIRGELAELFRQVAPGSADPEIDPRHAGLAIAAQNPKLALALARLSGLIAGELSWSRRLDLRELAIQTVNIHFGSQYSFEARIPNALAGGIGMDQLAALRSWRTSTLFTEQQRLIIEYSNAVVSGAASDELFSRMTHEFGEKETIECTALVSFWSFWAMFLKATHPE